MGRKTTKEEIIGKINDLRKNIPNIVLRTSLIVGFPGESCEDFNELKDFIKTIKLDKVGVFTYSREEGTPAAIMEDQIDEEVKKAREEEIMLLQKEVSEEINKNKVGREYDVLIEKFNGEYYIGRSYEMAPDIDGCIYVKGNGAKKDQFCKVKIEKALEYDLVGVVCNESCK